MSDTLPEDDAPEGNAPRPVSPIQWDALVARIQSRDQAVSKAAAEELYTVINRGIRFYTYRQLGPRDLDDRVHDAFLAVLKAVKAGELREPERLMWICTHRRAPAYRAGNRDTGARAEHPCGAEGGSRSRRPKPRS